MLNKIRRAWRKVLKYPNCIVFFVPSREVGGSNDPVETMWARIPPLLGGSPRCVHMPERDADLFQALLSAGVRHAPRELVIFAHPSSTWSGFSVNPAREQVKEVLLPDWWSISGHRFERIAAHVCYGARVLRADPWQEVFPAWLSYKDDLHALLSTESDKKMWADLGKSIVDATVDSKTIQGLASRVRAAYWTKMAELRDCLNDGNDALHAIHLQMALDGITTSED